MTSVRGAGGGYRLARPADQITLRQIEAAVEGAIAAGIRTADVAAGGPAVGTRAMGEAIRARL